MLLASSPAFLTCVEKAFGVLREGVNDTIGRSISSSARICWYVPTDPPIDRTTMRRARVQMIRIVLRSVVVSSGTSVDGVVGSSSGWVQFPVVEVSGDHGVLVGLVILGVDHTADLAVLNLALVDRCPW